MKNPSRTRGVIYRDTSFGNVLEAYWAAFFDIQAIPWAYTAGGVVLQTGTPAPAFWLPDHRIWCGVQWNPPGEEYCRELGALARAPGQELHVLLLAGECWPFKYTAHYFRRCDPEDGEIPWDGTVYGSGATGVAQLCRCRRCEGLCILEDGDSVGTTAALWAWGDIGRHNCNDHDKCPVPFDEKEFRGAEQLLDECLDATYGR